MYSDILVEDFFKTHQIQNSIIYIETGYPLAGGLGSNEILEMWQNIYPWLDQVATVLGIGSAILNIVKTLIRKHIKQDHTPMDLVDLIYSRRQWNHNELAQYLETDSEKAKDMLHLFGFVYNRQIMLFVPGPDFEMIKETFMKVDIM